MIVIKLGGSLAAAGNLQACLDKIDHHYYQKKVVIVPGGGLFADQVRQLQQRWQFDDRTAHEMAILAMQQMALAFKALKPHFKLTTSATEFNNQIDNNVISIWSPNITELDSAGIPATWDITSDSLSAWLAKILNAEQLILIKSVKIDLNFDVQKLMTDQIVDASLYEYLKGTDFLLRIVYAKDFIS